MLTEAGYFWLGAYLVAMASGFGAFAIRSFLDYRSATKPDNRDVLAGIEFLLAMVLVLGAWLAWGHTAVTAYGFWW